MNYYQIIYVIVSVHNKNHEYTVNQCDYIYIAYMCIYICQEPINDPESQGCDFTSWGKRWKY